MSSPKRLGSLRDVLLAFSGTFVTLNEDLETVSLARGVLHKGKDLVPRIYVAPEAGIKIRCNATIEQERVGVFGLGVLNDNMSNLIEVSIDLPVRTVPFSPQQLDLIEKTTEQEIRQRMAERNLAGDGSSFHPD